MQYEFVESGKTKVIGIENTIKVKFWTNESFYEESSSLFRLKEESCKVIRRDVVIAYVWNEIFSLSKVINALHKIFQTQKTAKVQREMI